LNPPSEADIRRHRPEQLAELHAGLVTAPRRNSTSMPRSLVRAATASSKATGTNSCALTTAVPLPP